MMRLPKERIIFLVDTIPVGTVPGRGMIDFYPLEAEGFIKKVIAMDWDRMIPGHPGPGGRLGTKQDAQDQLALLQDASAEMKKLDPNTMHASLGDGVPKRGLPPRYRLGTAPGRG